MDEDDAIKAIRNSLIADESITALVSAANIIPKPSKLSNTFPCITFERIGVGKGFSYSDKSKIPFGIRIIVMTKQTLQKTIEIYGLIQINLTKKISKITRLDPSPLGVLDTGDVEIYSYGGDFTGYYWSDD